MDEVRRGAGVVGDVRDAAAAGDGREAAGDAAAPPAALRFRVLLAPLLAAWMPARPIPTFSVLANPTFRPCCVLPNVTSAALVARTRLAHRTSPAVMSPPATIVPCGARSTGRIVRRSVMLAFAMSVAAAPTSTCARIRHDAGTVGTDGDAAAVPVTTTMRASLLPLPSSASSRTWTQITSMRGFDGSAAAIRTLVGASKKLQ